MARTRMVNGVAVPLTPDEEAARDVEELAGERRRALRQWKQDLAALDQRMPRALEDLIEAQAADVRAKLPQETTDRLAAKKSLRAAKPE